MRGWYHLYGLRLLIILFLSVNFLKVTSSKALTSSNPENLSLFTLNSQRSQMTDTEQPPPEETCSYRAKPFRDEMTPIPLLTVLLENQRVVIEIRGSSVFTQEDFLTDEDIKKLITAYENRTLSAEEFSQVYLNLANAITQFYLNQGYITSKANPENPIRINEQGIAVIPIVEGRLSQIQVLGRERLNLSYLCHRVALGVDAPINIIELEKQLRLLNLNPLLETIEASLRGTGQTGLSVLVVTVVEANPIGGSLSVDNYSPPTLGSERIGAGLYHRNLSGIGDQLFLNYYNSTSNGNRFFDATYQVPLNPMEGTLQLRVTPQWTKITLPPFDQLEITGQNQGYQITYRQPLKRTLSEEFALSVGFQYQDGRTLGLGRLETLERTNSSVFQFSQDYLNRDPQGIWLVRSQFNWGTQEVDRTEFAVRDFLPGGSLFNWLGQVQRLQRLNDDHLLIIQADFQLSADPLISYYLFVMGGGQSLRGYRQNARSGDNGFRLSIEDRITLVRDEDKNPYFQIAPFIDLGKVWNSSGNRVSLPSQTFLVGTGLGIIWNPLENLSIRLDYGIPWVDLDDRGNNLQDDGFYFQVILSN
ncbi:surface antigen (D15) [Gloeothece citriformis PCC 7424]|uniref:Surface antigen (D15) n=1 Tax=Gloeothece citriformis (strain PCC 7424) TaxID=65393 RepID=B7KJR9_GLOC7|nr:ShlB/FhaC/HecB family hemolysin secretion/activation protein [Gloeothece citriformis]ACK69518.1 surface antigen (D15) [Gloeothece citriformis PCC 7424]